MKKVFLSLTIVLLSGGMIFAQSKKDKHASNVEKVTTAATTTPASSDAKSSLVADNMAFKIDNHDFGTVSEGPVAEFVFQFTNTGKEPILIQKAQPSCGCTASDYTKEPIAPGKEGTIKASYNTNGRPGPFTKTITVVSNAGTKVLTLKGTVEKAPTNSVPENNSLIKTN